MKFPITYFELAVSLLNLFRALVPEDSENGCLDDVEPEAGTRLRRLITRNQSHTTYGVTGTDESRVGYLRVGDIPGNVKAI
ncbi:MAG: hypothetical protein M1839_001918 [Geoglossum umbratile]|nr:MAG: hypothetical protein M1839_001918 [Geoglossum umbratile]